MFHLSKFPSAAFSSVDVATATPSSSVLQSENLSCVKHTAIKGYKLIYKNVRRKEQLATDKYRKVRKMSVGKVDWATWTTTEMDYK